MISSSNDSTSKNHLSTVERLFVKAAPWLIALAAVMLIFALAQLSRTTEEVRMTSAYTRVSNCILGKAAYLPVEQHDIETCYEQVEKDTDVPLKRFDYEK